MASDPEQEFFADGIAEDVITALSRYPSLFVIARNSCFTYKGRAVDVKQVGRELGVRYVLEGSLRKAGNRIRVTAQLIEAETGKHVWAERYDRDLADIFAVQDEITEAVTIAVAPAIADAEQQRAMRKPPGEPRRLGRLSARAVAFEQTSAEDNASRRGIFSAGHRPRSDFCRGLQGPGRGSLKAAATYQRRSSAEAQSSAEALARRALALEGADAEARTCLGGVATGAIMKVPSPRSNMLWRSAPTWRGARDAGVDFDLLGAPQEGIAALARGHQAGPANPNLVVWLAK